LEKSDQETVGVALAAYNGAKFIARQLNSILTQSCPPDKIVVVDDGSTDETPQILEGYSRTHGTLEVHRNAYNLGYIKNFEKAIGLCQTDYVALSDQDDIWHPEKLARCVAALREHRGAGLCYHNTGLLGADDQHIDLTLWDLSEWQFPLTKAHVQKGIADRRGPLPGFALVMHRDLVSLLLPIPGNLYCGHDWWINAIAFFLFEPVCIPDPMAYYRMHPGQVSGAADSLLKGTAFEKKKRLFDIERIKRNVKREVYRLFNRKAVLARKRQDAHDQRQELARCLEALRKLIISSERINDELRTRYSDLLLHEQQRLFNGHGDNIR
jgi:glycosyltransferase involved in cell wall biosynthesis